MKDLWIHRCLLKPSRSTHDAASSSQSTGSKQLHERMMTKSKLLMPPPVGVRHELQALLMPMNSDTVSRIVKSDSLILELAQREFLRVGHDKDQHNHIRNKLRELGRLLMQLRRNANQPNASLQDFIHAGKLADIVRAVQDIAGFTPSQIIFKVPSLALKIGHSIKKCATIVKATALESGDKQTVEIADNFAGLLDIKWKEEIAGPAQRTLHDGKRNKLHALPTSANVVKMTEYIRGTAKTQVDILTAATEESAKTVTLTQVILFNRSRQGEASKMKLQDFHKRHTASASSDYGLSKLEQQLCRLFEVVEVVGKRGRTVPVILSSDIITQMTTLTEKRGEAGVAAGNKHVFARSSYDNVEHIRGSDCMKKHAELSGVSDPQSMRSLKLRKQVAISSQMLALKEHELDLWQDVWGTISGFIVSTTVFLTPCCVLLICPSCFFILKQAA